MCFLTQFLEVLHPLVGYTPGSFIDPLIQVSYQYQELLSPNAKLIILNYFFSEIRALFQNIWDHPAHTS